jgi:hypothetical protein
LILLRARNFTVDAPSNLQAPLSILPVAMLLPFPVGHVLYLGNASR